jgi:hypothetical protein
VADDGAIALKIEAITICVGYGDFLRESACVNRALVDD